MKRWSDYDPALLRRVGVTGGAVLLAVLAVGLLWWSYMLRPWTRDGRVRAEIVAVAAEIPGKVTEVRVADNQFVHKGDVLFVVDPEDYRLQLAQAEATCEARRQQMEIRQADAARRRQLSVEAVSQEERETAESEAAVAAAAYAEAQASLATARLHMRRTEVLAPANGYVTNFHLRVGDYATPGQAKMSVIDSDSFWIAGYFEETKIPRIREGDGATIRLMGVGDPLEGHVESISRGIVDANAGLGQGLAEVNPVFNWVRLAQRIPVRIIIDRVPSGVILAAGMTCTVSVHHRRHS
ncbi:MAG: HlyD family secretion protein [Verrucomicrobium sp.]|nr:HlyD family secretion protein [Verrucomicrobium sp.]